MDPVGPHRQRVGGVETQEGQTPKGERVTCQWMMQEIYSHNQ